MSIESEETRKLLLDDIKHWAERNTWIMPYLREYDISSLVDLILERFYRVTLCCGHKVRSCDEGVRIAFKNFIVDRGDMEEGGGIGVVSGLYCKECAEEYKRKWGAWEVDE